MHLVADQCLWYLGRERACGYPTQISEQFIILTSLSAEDLTLLAVAFVDDPLGVK